LSRPQFNDRRCLAFRRARQACPSESSFGGTCLSGPLSYHGLSIAVLRARQACPSESFFGGTCLSGPLINVRSSIDFQRGLKSRDESGAKAPHSMECGDSSPLFGEGFSLHNLGVDPDRNGVAVGAEPEPLIHPMEGHVPGRPFMRCQVHLPEGPARRVRSRTFDHPFAFTGHDKRAPPNHFSEGPACQVRFRKGSAWQVRLSTIG
jgi:hypothetical protein